MTAQENPPVAEGGTWVNTTFPASGPADVASYDTPTTHEMEVYERETFFTTQRAIRVEAKAREMKAYYNMALSLSKTTMVKECYQWNGITDKEHPQYDMSPVQNLAAAMMFGAKLGIEPEDAGLLVISIKGTPTLEAKTMVGIVRTWCDKRVAQGRTKPFNEGGDWIWEVSASETEVVWAARRDGDEKSCAWTITRADVAGYTDDIKTRNGNRRSMYKTIPIEMLRARAQSEVARLQFSDVLRGMQYSAEEMQLVERSVERPVQQVRPGRGMAALEQHMGSGAHLAAYGGPGAVADAEVVNDPEDPHAPPVEPETAQEDSSPQEEPVTDKELTPVHILLGEAGITERGDKLVVLGALVDNPELSSSKNLTHKEVAYVVSVLNQWKKAGVAHDNCRRLQQGQGGVDIPPQPADKASTAQLRKVVNGYKKAGVQGADMLEHISGVVGWNCDDINTLSEDDANDVLRKLPVPAHG